MSHEAPTTTMPEEQLPLTATERLADLNQTIRGAVPASLEDAREMVRVMREEVRPGMRQEGDKATIGGEVIPDEVASEFRGFAQRGLDNWRLDSDARSSAHAAAHADHPSELTPVQRKELNALKPDPQTPNSAVFDKYKAMQAQRLKLDEEIAEATHKKVAEFAPEYASKLEAAESSRNAAQAERNAKEAARKKIEADAIKAGEAARDKKAAEDAAREEARKQALDRVAEFIKKPESKFAAGSDVKRETGLTREDIQALGYPSYEAMKQDAEALNAQREREAQAAAVLAEAKAKADAWNAEREEHRRQKAEAQDRVERLVNQYKFKHGGQKEFDTNPKLAARVRADAIAQAEAEGLSVGDLKPSEGMAVPRNRAGEAQSDALAEALKRGGANAWVPADEAAPEASAEPTDGSEPSESTSNVDTADVSSKSPTPALDRARRYLESLRNRKRSREDFGLGPEIPVPSRAPAPSPADAGSETTQPIEPVRAEESPEPEQEPAVAAADGQPVRSRKMGRRILDAIYLAPAAIHDGRAQTWMRNRKQNGEGEHNGERNRGNKVAAVAAVLGAVAAAAATGFVLSRYGFHTGGAVRHTADNLPPKGGVATNPDLIHTHNPQNPDLLYNPPASTPNGFHEATLQPGISGGDSIWREARLANPGATEDQIHDIVGGVLRDNGWSLEDARHLPVGTKIRVPVIFG